MLHVCFCNAGRSCESERLYSRFSEAQVQYHYAHCSWRWRLPDALARLLTDAIGIGGFAACLIINLILNRKDKRVPAALE